jgi:hypothetical protein
MTHEFPTKFSEITWHLGTPFVVMKSTKKQKKQKKTTNFFFGYNN